MKNKALAVIDILKKEYPDADCTLDYDQAWKLLVSVRLAAQCTDARVNVVVEKLYEKYPDVNALAAATPEEIEEIVRPCGLGKSKARDINLCMKMLRDEYNCVVPDNMDDLLRLPGVGRKSANLILGDVFGKPAIVADTHCIRLSNRLGFINNTDMYKVEIELKRVVAPEKQNDFCHRLVEHGRAVCTARKAMCDKCVLADYCAYKKKEDRKALKAAEKAVKANKQ
jgi:endonuclease-3